MTEDQKKALEQATQELIDMPKEEFDALLAKHGDSDIAQVVSQSFWVKSTEEISKLRAERDALAADNAALREALGFFVHAENGSIAAFALSQTSPGAKLLAELKALREFADNIESRVGTFCLDGNIWEKPGQLTKEAAAYKRGIADSLLKVTTALQAVKKAREE